MANKTISSNSIGDRLTMDVLACCLCDCPEYVDVYIDDGFDYSVGYKANEHESILEAINSCVATGIRPLVTLWRDGQPYMIKS